MSEVLHRQADFLRPRPDSCDTRRLRHRPSCVVGPPRHTTYLREDPTALDAILRISGHNLDLPSLLGQVGAILLSATGADRASFFLLQRAGADLDLWSVTGREPDAQLWNLGLSMPSISLDEVPMRRALIEAGEPIAIEDARTSGLVPDAWKTAFDIGSVLIAPLRAGGESLGVVAVDYHYPRSFSAEDVGQFRALSLACSIAIAGTIVGHHLADVAVVSARQAWVAEHGTREEAIAEERHRVVQDVQTTVGSLLQAIVRQARHLGPDAAGLSTLAEIGIDELCQLGRTLPALSYSPLGFETTMRGLVERLGSTYGANATFDTRGEARQLDVQVEQILLRVVHETLSRIARRGKATAVVVLLEFADDDLALVIRDDGVDLSTRESANDLGPHHGLRLMQRRLEELGGRVLVERSLPRGIQVTAKVPA